MKPGFQPRTPQSLKNVSPHVPLEVDINVHHSWESCLRRSEIFLPHLPFPPLLCSSGDRLAHRLIQNQMFSLWKCFNCRCLDRRTLNTITQNTNGCFGTLPAGIELDPTEAGGSELMEVFSSKSREGQLWRRWSWLEPKRDGMGQTGMGS